MELIKIAMTLFPFLMEVLFGKPKKEDKDSSNDKQYHPWLRRFVIFIIILNLMFSYVITRRLVELNRTNQALYARAKEYRQRSDALELEVSQCHQDVAEIQRRKRK